jgi:hypothetical protein
MTDQNQRPTPRPSRPDDRRRPQPETEPIIIILGPATPPGPHSAGNVAADLSDPVEQIITLLAHGVLAVLVIVRARTRHHSATELVLTVARVLVRGL